MNIINYPEFDNPNFSNIINNKKEFYDFSISENKKPYKFLENYQQLISNYINPNTQYNNLLLYHSTGLGKTITSIAVAENLKNNYKILILVKNSNIQKNFINELIYTYDGYTTEEEKKQLKRQANIQTDKILHDRLIANIMTRINKYYKFITYGQFVNRVIGNKIKNIVNKTTVRKIKGDYTAIKNINDTLLIIDEAHNITNNDYYLAVKKILDVSRNTKLLLLSATPIYDNIKEMFELSNLLNDNNNQLPIRDELLKEKYIKLTSEIKKTKKNKLLLLNENIFSITSLGLKHLLHNLRGRVSYLRIGTEHYPEQIFNGTSLVPQTKNLDSIKIVKCKMSEYHSNLYINTIKGYQNLENDEDTNILSAKTNDNSLFKMISDLATIAYPNNTYSKDGFLQNFIKRRNYFVPKSNFLKMENINKFSTKLFTLLSNIKKSSGLIFIYSNYVNYGGISLIKYLLLENNYHLYNSSNVNKNSNGNFVIISEKTSSNYKFKILNLFNSPENINGEKIKIIIGSPLVAEGLTFKNVRQLHVLEPYWNLSKIDQIIGRCVRNYSHALLPKKQQNINIFLYCSVLHTGADTIDLEKYKLSQSKDYANKLLEYYIKLNAFDCNLQYKRNFINNSKLDGKRICNYKPCHYTCNDTTNKSFKEDFTTYNLKHHDLEKYNFIKKHIINLFKINYIYTLDDFYYYFQNLNYNFEYTDIYIVLYDVILSKVIIFNPNNIESYIINVSPYYIVNPINNVISESLFNKLNLIKIDKIYKKNISIEDILKEDSLKQGSLTINKPPEIIKKNLNIINILKSKYNINLLTKYPVVGLYFNKFGEIDNVFRLLETKDLNLVDLKDNRKINLGKTCTFYDKPELLNIANNYKIQNIIKQKKNICMSIEDFFNKNNIILKI